MKMTNTNHSKQIERAMLALQKQKKTIEKAHYRLNYHFMAPAGWLNDPNGLIQHNGLYHLFYQHHPYNADWGPMHWGHAVSSDLIEWQHKPAALAPSEVYDHEEANEDIGCFSGSAVSCREELVLIYTGHISGRTPKEVQAAAVSQDGIHFEKKNKNPIISEPPSGLSEDFRDPKVWKYNDTWYVVIGSSINGNGAVSLFQSNDLDTWEYRGIALEGDGTQGDMWECPDLFPLGEKHALVLSPMNMENGKNIVMIGDMDYSTGKFLPESQKEIDDGLDFYAAQTFQDEKGRWILIAWMDTWETDFPTKAEGWAGAMTIPREVVLDEQNKVKLLPVRELENLRGNQQQFSDVALNAGESFDLNGDGELAHSYEIKVDIKINENKGKAGLHLRASSDGQEKTLVYYDMETNELVVDSTASGGATQPNISKTEVVVQDTISLRLFMDTCSLEVCTGDGGAWITNRIYPEPVNTGMQIYTENTNVMVEEVNVWSLKKVIE
ncbi:glycoside hydrolase family 32 protein [Alteribacillus sp. HJP-4]|uniref:glycoside hydrolase family 32 protein n=1 Tax=Alteribacillus sp. HJP-4 TaxID=2775394 RepID=UPI0035CD3232